MSMDRAALAHLRHELRTPLNHIIGYSEMLLEDVAAGGAAAALESGLRRVHEQAQRLLTLINDFLGQSHTEAGEVDLRMLAAGVKAPWIRSSMPWKRSSAKSRKGVRRVCARISCGSRWQPQPCAR